MTKSDPTPRLVRFKIDHPPMLPPFNTLSWVQVANPPPVLDGWSLAIRGAAAFLISPRGWVHGSSSRAPNGPVSAIGPIPLAHVTLVWELEDAALVDKLQRYDLAPMKRAAVVPDEMPVLDAKEIGDP